MPDGLTMIGMVPSTRAGGPDTRNAPADGSASRATPAAARILVVEDEFFVAMELESALGDAGFDVIGVAASADEAVRLAKAHKPALVLMDIRLIGTRDGVDAALEIFDATGARAIFTSAHSDAKTHSRAARAAPHGWIAKPYRMAPLLIMIRAALSGLERH